MGFKQALEVGGDGLLDRGDGLSCRGSIREAVGDAEYDAASLVEGSLSPCRGELAAGEAVLSADADLIDGSLARRRIGRVLKPSDIDSVNTGTSFPSKAGSVFSVAGINIGNQHHLMGVDKGPEGNGSLVGSDSSRDFGVPEIRPHHAAPDLADSG